MALILFRNIFVLTVQQILLTLNGFNALCHKSSERVCSLFCSLRFISLWDVRMIYAADVSTSARLLMWKAHLRILTPPDITHLIFIWRTCFSAAFFLPEIYFCSIFMPVKQKLAEGTSEKYVKYLYCKALLQKSKHLLKTATSFQVHSKKPLKCILICISARILLLMWM